MTSYHTYPNLPSGHAAEGLSALPEAPPQVAYHLKVVQANLEMRVDR